MVLIENLIKTYGEGENSVEALKGINLHIEKGEIFGIIGLSGAGKSSLVRCINMLEKPTSGTIKIDGKELSSFSKKDLREARKNIGMVFQHFNLLMNSTVFENVAFPMVIDKKPKEYINKKVMELLKIVGLSDKKDMYPSMLSGGQKQRVGIARAIACEPSIIMCDEATSALDPETTKSILKLLKEINEKLGITIILITHEMEVVKEICSKVAILEKGKIAECGNVYEIFINPKTKVARSFFESVDIKLENEVYKKALDGEGVVIKGIFIGETSTAPYISKMISKYNVEVSILLGNIQNMNNTLIGTLVIKITGENENIKKGIEYLKENNVIVEEVQNEQ
ncbi:MAG: ATP-binding cassette domain-containing protein [Eubacteriales bacterium]|nr:ATP-binding cassette domain-containing protein [Eubacteriales bacterium]